MAAQIAFDVKSVSASVYKTSGFSRGHDLLHGLNDGGLTGRGSRPEEAGEDVLNDENVPDGTLGGQDHHVREPLLAQA